MEKPVYILLDVGGTGIKAGAAENIESVTNMNIREYDARSRESADAIFDNFLSIIGKLAGLNEPCADWRDRMVNGRIVGLGFTFPGPFDYEKGICLIRGLNKYESIYGLCIKDELVKRAPALADIPMIFLHDVEAFSLGAECRGRALCICIGTGCGSAFLENGFVIKKKSEHVPANGWIYADPFKESITDDYVSARGLAALSKEMMGEELSGKELADRCAAGNRTAVKVYEEFGRWILDVIKPYLDGFKPDELVFGGKISGSFRYFGEAVSSCCADRGIAVRIMEETTIVSFKGLFGKLRTEIQSSGRTEH